MKAKKTEYEMTSLEMENLLRQLKVELGIEGESKGGSNKTFLGEGVKPYRFRMEQNPLHRF